MVSRFLKSLDNEFAYNDLLNIDEFLKLGASPHRRLTKQKLKRFETLRNLKLFVTVHADRRYNSITFCKCFGDSTE